MRWGVRFESRIAHESSHEVASTRNRLCTEISSVACGGADTQGTFSRTHEDGYPPLLPPGFRVDQARRFLSHRVPSAKPLSKSCLIELIFGDPPSLLIVAWPGYSELYAGGAGRRSAKQRGVRALHQGEQPLLGVLE